MKKILIGVGIVIVVLIAAIIAIPFFVPVETLRAQAVEQVEKATGRKLTIAGPVKFAVFPSLAVEAEKVTFSNAPGASDPNMVSLSKVQVALKLFPLISGEIAIDQFVLVDPVINLEVDRNGKPNWQFDTAAAPAAQTPAQRQAAPAASGGSSFLQQLRLGDVRLNNGKLTYRDAKAGTNELVDKIDVKLALPSIDKPLTAEGSVTWHGKALKLDARVGNPQALLVDNKASDVSLKLASEPVNLTFGGTAKTAPPLAVNGDIDLNVPSVRGLAAWTGNPIKFEGNNLGPLAIKGKLAMNGDKTAFQNASLSLDAIKATGNFEVDTGGAKPYAKAQLAVDRLDLDPYLPPEKPAAQQGRPAGGAPQGRAAAADDWSDDPIDLSGLRAANADLALTVASIRMRKIEVGKSALNVALKDGRMNADLSVPNLYEGQGSGLIVLDGGGAGAGLQSNFKLAGLQIAPLLGAAADMDMMSGKGALDVEVTSRGASQRQIVSALNGKGSVKLNDGTIKGIDFTRILCNPIEAIQALGGNTDPNAKTQFSELGMTYTITNGMWRNQDLAMLAPLFRVEGAGTADLPKRTVNYRPVLKLVASCAGQGGALGKVGVGLPLIVSGPWSNVSVRPDFNPADLLKGLNPAEALKNPAEALRGILPGTGGSSGGSSGGSGGTTQPSQPSNNPLGGAVRGLFGR
jgi:AsmA protein